MHGHPRFDIGDLRRARPSPDDHAAGAPLQLVIEHDDPVREYEYSKPDGTTLAAAKKYSWTVVSIRRVWNRGFDDAGK